MVEQVSVEEAMRLLHELAEEYRKFLEREKQNGKAFYHKKPKEFLLFTLADYISVWARNEFGDEAAEAIFEKWQITDFLDEILDC